VIDKKCLKKRFTSKKIKGRMRVIWMLLNRGSATFHFL
jgi:hypothetical protein